MPSVARDKVLKKFIELHKKKTGITLDDQIALEHFMNLINLVRSIYRPIPRSEKKAMERPTSKHDNENLET